MEIQKLSTAKNASRLVIAGKWPRSLRSQTGFRDQAGSSGSGNPVVARMISRIALTLRAPYRNGMTSRIGAP